MDTIFFCSHNPNAYNIFKWRSYFSQWYMRDFQGSLAKENTVYDLTVIIPNEHHHLVNRTFCCREQWMMALKALIFAKGSNKNFNLNMFEKIMNTKSQKDMRSMGRKVRGYDQSVWDSWRYKIVVNGNYLQFSQDDQLKKILLETNNREIVEAAWYDKIWGIGYNEKDARKVGRQVWEKNGRNLLGKALMEVRDKLKN